MYGLTGGIFSQDTLLHPLTIGKRSGRRRKLFGAIIGDETADESILGGFDGCGIPCTTSYCVIGGNTVRRGWRARYNRLSQLPVNRDVQISHLILNPMRSVGSLLKAQSALL